MTLGVAVPRCLGAAAVQCPDGAPPPCRAVAAAALPLDSNAVAILPFSVQGPRGSVEWLASGMVDVLSGALDGVGGWRAVSPRTVLARIPRAGLDVPRAAQSARALGAGQMISGSAVVIGPTVRLRAELYSTQTLQRIGAPVEARAALEDPAPAMDSLAVALSRLRLGTRGAGGGRSPDLGTSSPQALRAAVAAEELMRRGQIQAAADSLQAAIAHDSGFVAPYYRLYIVGQFGGSITPWTSLSVVRAAMRRPQRLTGRQRLTLRTMLALQEGQRQQALELGAAVGAAFPDDAEAAYMEGETGFHMGLSLGESPTPPLRAFERGITLDSTLLDNYNHAIELRYRQGDLDGARYLLQRGLARWPGNVILNAQRVVDRVAGGEDPGRIAREVRGTLPNPEAVLLRCRLEALRMFDADPVRAFEVLERLARMLQDPAGPRATRAAGMHDEAELLAGRGQYRAAQDALDAAAALGAPPGEVAALLALAGGARQWPASLTTTFDDLPELTAAVGSTRRGWERLQAGDSAAARGDLQSSFQVRPAGGGAALIYGTLLLARLDLAAGAPRVAWQHAQDRIIQLLPVPLCAEFEELRGMIAERLGDREAAIVGYRNFAALWAPADPELQPRVAAARAALARLGAPQ